MCYDADFKSCFARLPSQGSKDLVKRDFLDIYLIMFSESAISEMQNLWASSFFQNV